MAGTPWAVGGAGAAADSALRARSSRVGRRSAALLLLTVHLAGCYSYVAMTEPLIPVGREVAVAIGEAGSSQIADLIGPGANRVYGRVVVSTDTSLTLAVSAVQHESLAVPVSWAGQQVTLHRGFIRNVQIRTLSRTRSAIAGGLLVVGALAASLLVVSGYGSEDGGNRLPPEPPTEQ
jgi:hypothetical protein